MRSSVRHANKTGRDARLRIGLIVNPIAGMGGPSGLKGTDGAGTVARATAAGVAPLSEARAGRALQKLLPLGERIAMMAAAGGSGGALARRLGFDTDEIGQPKEETSAADTSAAAREMARAAVDLILFAGGDGTARDVFGAAREVPLLGIPTGVKMHSAVFAASPEAAGQVAAAFARDPAAVRWRSAEVMDIDEEALAAGKVAARLHGYALTPDDRRLMQNCKARGGSSDDAALDALANRIVAGMDPATVYVLGCGETLRRVKRRLGGEGTLLGIDVAVGGRLVATDVDQARLMRLTDGAPTRVIVSVTGGQGFIFGRGNQQIGASLLKRIGRDAITIITGQSKLTDLDPACLRVDTGDLAVDAMLAGYVRVQTAPGRSMMMRVAA